MSIGHDILALRYPGTDVHATWLNLGPLERIAAFRSWLGEAQNQPSLFIVDDIDGMSDDAAIQAALPRDAQSILLSTRDPSIVDSLGRECEELRIPPMDVDEMACLMASVLRRSKALQVDITEEELEVIAKVVDGHPLGACRAISYIIHVVAQTAQSRPVKAFLDMISSSDWKARLKFLQYKPRFSHSIMETFEVSLQRLRQHQADAIILLELIAFLSSTDDNVDFRRFLDIERPWLTEVKASLPNFETFAKGLSDQNEILAELENVSIGFRPSLSRPLRLHPLWTECILQRTTHDGRSRWLGQILLLCYESWRREERIAILHPYVHNCVEVAERFDIDLERLLASEDLSSWIREVTDPGQELIVSEEHHANTEAGNRMSPLSQPSEDDDLGPESAHASYEAMKTLHEDCKDVQRSLPTNNQQIVSTETYQHALAQILPLLKRLRSLEESPYDGHLNSTIFREAHLETYDVLIEIAPLMRVHNPTLLDQLYRRKQDRVKEYGLQDS